MFDDDRAARPIAGLLVFITISAALVHLATNQPFVGDDQEIEVGTNQTEVQGEPEGDDIGTFTQAFLATNCVITLGLSEFLFQTCSKGFGVDLQDITIVRTITEGLGGMIELLTDLATFNVPGAPEPVRYVIGTSLGGIVAYVVIVLVRGA